MTHVPWHPEEMTEGEELHGIESVELLSVGIDIGTTTTQLMFSKMVARRRGGEYSSKFQIEDREIVYESPVRLTPYEDEHRIDAQAVDDYILEWYSSAGYEPDDIDTGAVIITGEANRKENADRIIELFSQQSGRFVCATAGANLETLMATHGSGAVDYSLDENCDVLHIDIGGGTTKLAYIVDGFVEETAAINVGARLVAFDDDGNLTKVEPAARAVGDTIGVELSVGEPLKQEEKERLAKEFAALLFEVVDGLPSDLARKLMVTELPEKSHDFDIITFSGGGAEYVYDRDPGYFNDLGAEFGESISTVVENEGIRVGQLDAGIRATAIGSNQHTVQVSGNTIRITDESVLPARNVPMVPFVMDQDDSTGQITQDVIDKLDLYDVDLFDQGFAFGIHMHGTPTYDFLRKITDAAVAGWERVDGRNPLVLAFDADVAMNAGKIIDGELDVPIVSIDGVELDQFGYLDIGEPLEETNAVPLTVKSLLFEG